jgi:hypothetical protein
MHGDVFFSVIMIRYALEGDQPYYKDTTCCTWSQEYFKECMIAHVRE